MIKVMCIKSFEYEFSIKGIIKGNIYYIPKSLTENKWTITAVYDANDNCLGAFTKDNFITLDEWRNQQINKILYD